MFCREEPEKVGLLQLVSSKILTTYAYLPNF